MSPKTIILSAVGFIVAGIMAVVIYQLSIKVEQVHEQNVAELSTFGTKVIPLSSREGRDGVTFGLEGGNIQLPPTLQQKKLSSTEKIILALSREKDELLIEAAELNDKLAKQGEQLYDLRSYKAENERFAPEQLEQERTRAQSILKEYFDKSSDVTQYNQFEQQIMGLATANLYTEVLRQHQLILNDSFKDKLLKTLPQYGLCLAPNIAFIANNRYEEKLLSKALRAGQPESLQGNLKLDFDAIHEPCLRKLNTTINALLEQHKNELDEEQQIADSSASADDSEDSPGPLINPGASPTEQLIQTLTYDKEQLLTRVKQLKEQYQQQQQELGELGEYRQSTERYAPLPALEERNRAHKLLLDYFDTIPEANRFNPFELNAMSLAAANHYAAFNKQNRLIMTESLKDLIIRDYLPRYGFCFGDGLKFVISSRLQERQLINALREQDIEYMGQSLQQQIDSITKPCAAQLSQQLQTFL